jgi:hypothetical protein
MYRSNRFGRYRWLLAQCRGQKDVVTMIYKMLDLHDQYILGTALGCRNSSKYLVKALSRGIPEDWLDNSEMVAWILKCGYKPHDNDFLHAFKHKNLNMIKLFHENGFRISNEQNTLDIIVSGHMIKRKEYNSILCYFPSFNWNAMYQVLHKHFTVQCRSNYYCPYRKLVQPNHNPITTRSQKRANTSKKLQFDVTGW